MSVGKGVLGALGCCLMLAGAPDAAQATTWDAADDFSVTSNPNGVWSYLWGTPAAATLYTGIESISGHLAWYNGSTLIPLVLQDTFVSGPPPEYGADSTNTLALHPGDIAEYSIVRWISPSAGSYYFSGYFARNDGSTSGDGVIYDYGANSSS